MKNWTKTYIRAFLGMIGLALIFAGLAASQFLGGGFSIAYVFVVIGFILLIITGYWWYKDFQQKGKYE